MAIVLLCCSDHISILTPVRCQLLLARQCGDGNDPALVPGRSSVWVMYCAIPGDVSLSRCTTPFARTSTQLRTGGKIKNLLIYDRSSTTGYFVSCFVCPSCILPCSFETSQSRNNLSQVRRSIWRSNYPCRRALGYSRCEDLCGDHQVNSQVASHASPSNFGTS